MVQMSIFKGIFSWSQAKSKSKIGIRKTSQINMLSYRYIDIYIYIQRKPIYAVLIIFLLRCPYMALSLRFIIITKAYNACLQLYLLPFFSIPMVDSMIFILDEHTNIFSSIITLVFLFSSWRSPLPNVTWFVLLVIQLSVHLPLAKKHPT